MIKGQSPEIYHKNKGSETGPVLDGLWEEKQLFRTIDQVRLIVEKIVLLMFWFWCENKQHSYDGPSENVENQNQHHDQ